jgi:hypothetical protein
MLLYNLVLFNCTSVFVSCVYIWPVLCTVLITPTTLIILYVGHDIAPSHNWWLPSLQLLCLFILQSFGIPLLGLTVSLLFVCVPMDFPPASYCYKNKVWVLKHFSFPQW